MAVIQIKNFGGEMPRVSPRALPDGTAQMNKNLLATSSEFRPLQADTATATVVTGITTLHRFSRAPGGTLYGSGDDALGWTCNASTGGSNYLTSAGQDQNWVRGQINEDLSERTYVSINDGSNEIVAVQVPPSGATYTFRTLGVFPPVAVTATLTAGKYFTLADADAWVDATLIPAMLAAVTANTALNRTAAAPIYSGTPTLTQAGATRDLVLTIAKTDADTKGLNDAALGATVSGSNNILIPIAALPQWGAFTQSTASTVLQGIVDPQAATATPTVKVFSSTVANKICADINTAVFDASAKDVQAVRDALTAAIKEFKEASNFIITPQWTLTYQTTNANALELKLGSTVGLGIVTPPAPGTAVYEPAPPYSPVEIWVPPADVDTPGYYKTTTDAALLALWTDYNTKMKAYQTAFDSYQNAKSPATNDKTSRVANMVKAQADAKRYVEQIEQMYASRVAGITSFLEDYIARMGIAKTASNTTGLVTLDADKITESRSYFATYVTDRGEESAPSAPTALIDVSQKDTVTVRLSATMFQPRSGGSVTAVESYYTLVRIYRSNSGSTATNFQFVAEITKTAAVAGYVDTIKGDALGEVCPTITWAVPPYRMDGAHSATVKPVKGTNPFPRGLVGMPNGVMAAFLDSTVCFCEPYVPYAWPVEYQIVLEYPIVGFGVFGQTLFVGTYANPYLISGSDSASMSAQKLDSDQSCESRRSIVALNGGVVYASPDGLCFANSNGVELITGPLFSRQDWQALVPSSIFAAYHEGVYYFWFTGQYQDTQGGCLALDFAAKKLTRVDMPTTAVYKDIITDAVFYVSGTSIKKAFSDSAYRTATWKSGKIVLPAQAPLAWLQVDGDQKPAVMSSATPPTVITAAIPATVVWHRYIENSAGALVDDPKTYTVTNGQPMRLHSGRYLEHEIEVVSKARVTKVMLTGSTEELKNG